MTDSPIRVARGRGRTGGAWRRVVIVLGLLVALVPAAPAHADNEDGASYTLRTSPITIERGGERYKLALVVTSVTTDGQTHESASVTLSQVRNPAGVRYAKQSHTYSFFLDGAFTAERSLSAAAVDTTDEMGDYGRLRLSFTASGDSDVVCKNATGVHAEQRTGSVRGTFALKTGTKLFGRITELPRRARLQWQDGQPCGDNVDPSTSCPAALKAVEGWRSSTTSAMTLSATRLRGARAAEVAVFWVDELGSGSNGNATRSGQLTARVPARHVRVQDDLSAATVRGAKGTWLRGSAAFAATRAERTSPFRNCSATMQQQTRYRRGTVTAGTTALRVASWLGKDPTLKSGPLSGSAGQTVLRAR